MPGKYLALFFHKYHFICRKSSPLCGLLFIFANYVSSIMSYTHNFCRKNDKILQSEVDFLYITSNLLYF
ncbi:hypothetical protein D1157_08910 [Anaerotruncus sp. X29]|nr:hypothetical protein [Anaerotruncus sp. X29]